MLVGTQQAMKADMAALSWNKDCKFISTIRVKSWKGMTGDTMFLWHDKQKKSTLNLINLFKLRVGINRKEYLEYDIINVSIIF
jgi:hypothetical protein